MGRISLTIIAVLLISTGLFATISYNLSVSLGETKEALNNAKTVVESLQESIKQQELSCKADDSHTVELDAEKRELAEKMDDIGKRLTLLSKQKPLYIVQEKVGNENAAHESNVVSNDALLSGELVRLLNESYCNVEANSPSCTTR